MNRKTKIVCTIGPASQDPKILEQMMAAGMDICRLNFSHGTHEEHRQTFELVRRVARTQGKHVAVLQDLCGPKIRCGVIDGGQTELPTGGQLTIVRDETLGTSARVSTTYAALIDDVKVGERIFIDDGLLYLLVTDKTSDRLVCTVINGGILKSHKGINLPGTHVSAPSLTDKDRDDLEFGLRLGVDYVALSFVRHPDDIRQVQGIIRAGGAEIGVIAKIEKPEAVDHLEEIVMVSDAIMIARGDLGVELPAERVPAIQMDILEACHRHIKPVITATQMLESMMVNPRPTRAEVSDVAYAVIGGTDALMLSGETAAGRYPVEAVRVMADVAMDAERYLFEKNLRPDFTRQEADNHALEALVDGATLMAEQLGAACIVVYTRHGATAAYISKNRSASPVIGITCDEPVARRMALYWGITPAVVELPTQEAEWQHNLEAKLLAQNAAQPGDRVVVVFSFPHAGQNAPNALWGFQVGKSA